MPKIGQHVKYRREDGTEILAQVVALSRDCSTQVVEPCPTCGAQAAVRRETPAYPGVERDDKTTVNLVELEAFQDRGQLAYRVLCGREAVPLAGSAAEYAKGKHVWIAQDEED